MKAIIAVHLGGAIVALDLSKVAIDGTAACRRSAISLLEGLSREAARPGIADHPSVTLPLS
jgi:hypothetical protein